MFRMGLCIVSAATCLTDRELPCGDTERAARGRKQGFSAEQAVFYWRKGGENGKRWKLTTDNTVLASEADPFKPFAGCYTLIRLLH